MTDRGYYNLLGHLSRSSTTLPISTLQASIAHYLAHVQPSPTPFVALVISSPLFRALSYPRLQALSTAFRHGVHIKLKLLQEKPSGLFSRSYRARVDEWVHAVLNGLQGGMASLKLACATGCLLGLEDWETDLKAKDSRMRRKVEEEVVVALAEVLEMYPYLSSAVHWETEFKHTATEDDAITTALLIASPCIPLISHHRLKALQLQTVCGSVLATITAAFQRGTFLSSLGASISQTADGILSIDASSMLAKTIREMATSPIMNSMAPLSRTCALTLSILVESQPKEGWIVITETMEKLTALSRTVETDWIRSPLASVVEESGIAPDSRELAATLWNNLKTLLFMNIMIVQSILTTLVYTSQPSLSSSDTSMRSPAPSSYSFALTALQVFSHLSFVLPQFGGVTSTAQGGFSELKKVFYTALDVISADKQESERFVHELSSIELRAKTTELPVHVHHAKKAYSLACIEQLVPVLSDECIRTDVYPMCNPHLSDSTHRETYESAHSVMLAIFASHARKAAGGYISEPFAEQIVPFYAQCLLDNSADGQLSTTQLCLAYAALVRSAGAFGTQKESNHESGDAFTWYCLQALLDRIHSISTQRPRSDHLHRLHLTLVATVPSVSLTLLPRLLDEIQTVMRNTTESSRREELVHALFKELLENVGDQEKEYVMRWWYEHQEEFGVVRTQAQRHNVATDVPEHDVQPDLVSHL